MKWLEKNQSKSSSKKSKIHGAQQKRRKACFTFTFLSSYSARTGSSKFHHWSTAAQLGRQKNNDCSVLYFSRHAEGSSTIFWTANFTFRVLQKDYGKFSVRINSAWNTGRGQKYSFTAKYSFAMMLYVLKHGWQWDVSARLSRIRTSVTEKMISSFVQLISNWSFEKQVLKFINPFMVKSYLGDTNMFYRFCMHDTLEMSNSSIF